MKLRRHLKKKEELFENLPSEIIIDILSRLPILTVINCKLVRKSWLALIETPEFVNSHLLKPSLCLVFYEFERELHTIQEFKDGLHLENHTLRPPQNKQLRPPSLFKFRLPCKCNRARASANGLLLHYRWYHPLTLIISNPVTREYFEPPKLLLDSEIVALGFGAAKISGQYKVVTIFKDKIPKSGCNSYVYTIGTGAWKKIAPPAGYLNHRGTVGYLDHGAIHGVFMNGNLHWLVADLKDSQNWISCLDLENELFTTFSLPLIVRSWDNRRNSFLICAVGDTLCLCNDRHTLTIFWLMMEYGVEKSWTKQFVILNESVWPIWPVEIFKDGDILMAWDDIRDLFCYSKTNKREHGVAGKFEWQVDSKPFRYTPNFLSLKRFERENVISF